MGFTILAIVADGERRKIKNRAKSMGFARVFIALRK
jgi:hypothetical protein